MITMQGNVAKLWRYRVEYEKYMQFPGPPVMVEDLPDGEGASVEEESLPLSEPEIEIEIMPMTEYAISEEHLETIKSRVGECQVTPIDQSGNEWIEGMKFASRDEAVEALEMGETVYRQQLHEQDTEARLQEQLLILAGALAELYERTVS